MWRLWYKAAPQVRGERGPGGGRAVGGGAHHVERRVLGDLLPAVAVEDREESRGGHLLQVQGDGVCVFLQCSRRSPKP